MYCIRRFLYRVTSYLSVALLSLVTSQCPDSAMKDLQSCIAASLPNFGLGPPVNESPNIALIKGKTMVRDSCTSSRLQKANECMQNIIDKCTGTTEQDQTVQRLFDKEKTTATIDYLCSNLNVYEKYTKCISEQHSEAENCTMDVMKSYQNKGKAEATMDVMIHATCPFHETAYHCLLEPVYNACGNEAAMFVQTILLGTRPPICKELKQKYHSSGNNGNTASTVGSFTKYTLILVFLSTYIYIVRGY